MNGTRIALPIALLAAAAGLRAEFLDSPMVRIGDELDLYFTAKARVEYDDNLFLGRPGNLPEAGTFHDLIPGLELQYGKDLPLSGSFGISRRHRTFFDSKLRNLDDEQDAYNFTAVYEGGGPLRVEAAATYGETARNTPEEYALADVQGTLVRQTAYLQSIKAIYQFTEKTNAGLGVRHSANRYDPRLIDIPDLTTPDPNDTVQVANTRGLLEYDSWALPLDVRYKYSDKLSVGVSLEYGESDLYLARPVGAYSDTLGRRFAGLTFNYMATDKLDCELRLGYLRSDYKLSGYTNESPSYSIRLSHSVTEKLNQGLLIAQDASAAPNGGLADAFQLGYDLNYNNSEAFRTFFRATYSESNVLASGVFNANNRIDVRSANAVIGVSYAPDTHWVFSANYSYTTNIEPSDYDVNRVSLEAALRW
jgi:hypothetical protein